MSAFDWHPRHHRAALDGMLALTLEERGAYNTILDLIYERGGAVPDDDRWLAGWMGCSTRRWNIIKAALIVKGKIVVRDRDGDRFLTNPRAEKELSSQADRTRKLSENGAKGQRKRRENEAVSNEIKEVAPARLKLKTETVDKNPPTPQGGSVLAKQLYDLGTKLARQRSSVKDTERSAAAALRRGKTPEQIQRGLAAYYASEEGRRVEKGVHRMIENDRFEAFLAPETDTTAWDDLRWQVAVNRWRRDGFWPEGIGPAPGQPGCRCPASLYVTEADSFRMSA